MKEPVVFLNGQYMPESAARVSVFDRAFCAGDGIYDVARTFGHVPNKLREHCARFLRSAAYTRIDLRYTERQLEEIGLEVLKHNLGSVDKADDRMLWMIATRGNDPPSRNPYDAVSPTLIVYTLPINSARFAKYYQTGATLVTVGTRRTPPECLDPRAKIINKMNHLQAEFEAKAVDREAFALMLATDGTVAESSASNVFFGRGSRLFTPRRNVLLGIMRENIFELARASDVELVEDDFYPYDIALADEIFLTTTSFSILPIGRFNGRSLAPVPGPLTTRLMNAWRGVVGIDFVQQAIALSGKAVG